jgi:hypothetical protein
MYFRSSFEHTIESKHFRDAVATLSPGRESLTITFAPSVPAMPVVAKARATAVQVGTTGSSVIAHFAQCVTVG